MTDLLTHEQLDQAWLRTVERGDARDDRLARRAVLSLYKHMRLSPDLAAHDPTKPIERLKPKPLRYPGNLTLHDFALFHPSISNAAPGGRHSGRRG